MFFVSIGTDLNTEISLVKDYMLKHFNNKGEEPI